MYSKQWPRNKMECEKFCTKEIGLNFRRHNGRKTTWDISELTAGETVGRNCKRNCWLTARKTIEYKTV